MRRAYIVSICSIILICSIAITGSALYSNNALENDVEVAVPQNISSTDVEKDGILYSVNDVSIVANSVPSTRSNMTPANSYDISVEILMNSADAIEIISAPTVAYDANYTELATISDMNYMENTLTIEFTSNEIPDDLYLQMPQVNKLLDNVVTLEDVNNLTTEVYEDNVNDLHFMMLTFDENALSVRPRLATITSTTSEDNFNCLYSNTFYDENAEYIGGRLVFVVPEDYEPENSYDLTINGTIEQVDIAELQIEFS